MWSMAVSMLWLFYSIQTMNDKSHWGEHVDSGGATCQLCGRNCSTRYALQIHGIRQHTLNCFWPISDTYLFFFISVLATESWPSRWSPTSSEMREKGGWGPPPPSPSPRRYPTSLWATRAPGTGLLSYKPKTSLVIKVIYTSLLLSINAKFSP